MRIFRLTAAAALAAVLPTLALAQPAPPPPGAPTPDAHAGHMRERRAEHVKMLHDILRIRPDQETAFQAWLAVMRPEHGAMGGMRGPGGPGGMGEGRPDMATMTTPQRLDMIAHQMDERFNRMRAEFQRRAEATKAFYGVLSPDQRKVMDDLHGMAGGMGHGGMGHDGWDAWHGGMDRGPHPMGPPPAPPSGE